MEVVKAEEQVGLTFLDAAYQVLSQAPAPMHYTEIAERALKAGYLDTRGQTPEATMGSRLYVDTKKAGSRFRRTGRGEFALAGPRQSDIFNRIDNLNMNVKKDLKKRLHRLSPEKFEILVGELLIALGFAEDSVEVTSHRHDGGVDVTGRLRAGGVAEISIAVQAKRWKRNVLAPIIQKLRGSLSAHEQGIIITTSGFSPGARREAEESGKARIGLVDGDQLVELLVQHDIGVTSQKQRLLSLDDEWWGEIAEDEGAAEPAPLKAEPDARRIAYPVSIKGAAGDESVKALLLDRQGRIEFRGRRYGSPSSAGKEATGWKAVNGWTYWMFQHPGTGQWLPIDKLRK